MRFRAVPDCETAPKKVGEKVKKGLKLKNGKVFSKEIFVDLADNLYRFYARVHSDAYDAG